MNIEYYEYYILYKNYYFIIIEIHILVTLMI